VLVEHEAERGMPRRMSKAFSQMILATVSPSRRPSVDSQTSVDSAKPSDSATVSALGAEAESEEAQAEREAIVGSLRLLEEAKAMYGGISKAAGG
jgi:hypothetical protein